MVLNKLEVSANANVKTQNEYFLNAEGKLLNDGLPVLRPITIDTSEVSISNKKKINV